MIIKKSKKFTVDLFVPHSDHKSYFIAAAVIEMEYRSVVMSQNIIGICDCESKFVANPRSQKMRRMCISTILAQVRNTSRSRAQIHVQFVAFNQYVEQIQQGTITYRPQATNTAERIVQILTRATKMYLRIQDKALRRMCRKVIFCNLQRARLCP